MKSAPRKQKTAPRVCASRIEVALAAALVLLLSVLGAHALDFPPLTGRVVDAADILDPATKRNLENKLADFETRTGGQFVVATLKSLQGTSIEDYGYQLGRHWQIGQKGKNNGLLLIVAPNERKVRIEVGYGYEADLTDAVSRLIIENAILPRFRANDYPGGVTRGVDDIIQALTVNPQEWKQRAQKRPDYQPASADTIVPILLVILLVVVFIMVMYSVTRQQAYSRSARRGGWNGPIIFPPTGDFGSGPSSSGSSSSDSSGDFSGGGGSFGGGGASGDW